jgi:DNA-binding response OmpR family regulator
MNRKRNALVIEHAKSLRDPLCAMLESSGFNPSGFPDAAPAIEAAANRNYQVVIVDYHLNEMNGVSVSRFLRMCYPTALIVGISADDRKEEFLLAGGADAFFQKPCRFADVLSLINATTPDGGYQTGEQTEQYADFA